MLWHQHIRTEQDRARVIAAVKRDGAMGLVVQFHEAKRTDAQNRRMWAHLQDVSRQATHHGLTYTPDEWKCIFMVSLGKEMRLAPNLDGDGMAPLGLSSSRLSKSEMGDLITLIEAYAAQNCIELRDPAPQQDSAAPAKASA